MTFSLWRASARTVLCAPPSLSSETAHSLAASERESAAMSAHHRLAPSLTQDRLTAARGHAHAHAHARPRPSRGAAGCRRHSLPSTDVAPSVDTAVERAVFAWLDEFIIGLELCPFAGAVRPATRVVSSHAASTELLLAELRSELLALQGALTASRATFRSSGVVLTLSPGTDKPLGVPATTLLTLHLPPLADFDAFMQLHEQAQAVALGLTRAHCRRVASLLL